MVLQFAVLLIYLPRYFGLEIAKWPFRSSSQTATCYYQSNHSKVEVIQLSVLPKDATSEHVGLSSHFPLMLNAEKRSCEYQI